MRPILHLLHRYTAATMLFFAAILFAACRHADTHDQLEAVIDSFATHYYNWQFRQALSYCTSESEPWLRFAASNVQQSDIDILRAQGRGASHQINDIRFDAGDSTALVSITVYHYLRMDTIGRAGQIADKASFLLPVIRRNGQWLVHLTAFPRGISR